MKRLITSLFVATVLAVNTIAVPSANAAGCVKVSPALGAPHNCVGGSTNPIYDLLHIIIVWLSGMFGLVLTLILVVAGFQYIVSNGSPDDTKSAKNRIKAALTGFILYIFMVGILQHLLPDGVKLFGP